MRAAFKKDVNLYQNWCNIKTWNGYTDASLGFNAYHTTTRRLREIRDLINPKTLEELVERQG
jgi:exoribonuclease II